MSDAAFFQLNHKENTMNANSTHTQDDVSKEKLMHDLQLVVSDA